MAFGGSLTFQNPGEAGSRSSTTQISDPTLAGRAGAFDVTAVDSGALTTDQTPPADHDAIDPGFGPGEGNWTQEDVDRVQVSVIDGDDTALATGSVVHLVSKVLLAGDLVVNFHNKGVGASGDLVIGLNMTE